MAAVLPGSIVLDQKLVMYGGERSRFEVCDILTNDRAFIHAKHMKGSSTLSHLWAQGTVSAEAFISEDEARLRIRTLLPDSQVDIVPVERPNPREYSVVYLLINAEVGCPWKSLPFFSKVALMQAARQFGLLGMPLAIAGTPPVVTR